MPRNANVAIFHGRVRHVTAAMNENQDRKELLALCNPRRRKNIESETILAEWSIFEAIKRRENGGLNFLAATRPKLCRMKHTVPRVGRNGLLHKENQIMINFKFLKTTYQEWEEVGERKSYSEKTNFSS